MIFPKLRAHGFPRLPAWFIGLLAALAVQAADEAPWKWHDPQDLKVPGLRHRTLESPSMKRTIGFNVYLPPQYGSEPNRRFPLVFFLHGSGGTESSDAGLAYTVHALIEARQIEPVIYVFPNGGKTSGYRNHKDSDVQVETMLTRELLPLLDHDYRTLAKPEGRGLCGFSMGGGGAIRLALKRPELFGAAASLAAALDQSPDENDGDNVYQHATALSREQRDRLRLYLVVGEDDFLFPRHPPFIKHLKELGIANTFVVHSKVDHNLGKLNELSADAMVRHLDRELKRLLAPPAAK